MGSMSRNKGKNWERACRKFFKRWMKEMDYTHVGTDEPDIVLEIGDFRIAVECKNDVSMSLPAWHRQAEVGMHRVEADAAVICAHRMGKTMVQNAWIIMSADDFSWWLQQIEDQ